MHDVESPLDDILASYAPAIESGMRAHLDVLEKSHAAGLFRMMAYHLGWRDANLQPVSQRTGKFIRPAMCLLACEAAGGDWQRAVPAAVALEMTHNFTLIHDDIQDGDIERRGRPTVWKLWGVPQAINAGDGLFVLARMVLHELYSHQFDAATIERVYQVYDTACLRLVEGQYLDIYFEQRLDVHVDEYLTMIRGKTAALVAASLEIGATLATQDAATIRAYRTLGEDLGLAFQIVDDILGSWGDEAVTGKPAGNDLRRKKKTLPVIFALERETNPDERPLHALYGKERLTDTDVAWALALLETAGARQFAENLAQEHWQRAMHVLSEMKPPTPARARLCALARFLVERKF